LYLLILAGTYIATETSVVIAKPDNVSIKYNRSDADTTEDASKGIGFHAKSFLYCYIDFFLGFLFLVLFLTTLTAASKMKPKYVC